MSIDKIEAINKSRMRNSTVRDKALTNRIKITDKSTRGTDLSMTEPDETKRVQFDQYNSPNMLITRTFDQRSAQGNALG